MSLISKLKAIFADDPVHNTHSAPNGPETSKPTETPANTIAPQPTAVPTTTVATEPTAVPTTTVAPEPTAVPTTTVAPEPTAAPATTVEAQSAPAPSTPVASQPTATPASTVEAQPTESTKQSGFMSKLSKIGKIMSESKIGAEENVLENRESAIELICNKLAPYTYTSDPNLAVLVLYVPIANESQVRWADKTFTDRLKLRLQEERIDAVKKIVVEEMELDEIIALTETDKNIKVMHPGRLYYKTEKNKPAHARVTRPTDIKDNETKAPQARLTCIAGEQFMASPVYNLDPEKQKVWHIGRCAILSPLEKNDIVIVDTCTDISRQQAMLCVEGGLYFLDCKKGGCRIKGGRLTMIHRASGTKEELVSLSHCASAPLNDGDVIQLAKSVYMRFEILPDKH